MNERLDLLLEQAARSLPAAPTCVAPSEVSELELAGYIERQLDAPSRDRVADHLARCEFCREVQAELIVASEGAVDDTPRPPRNRAPVVAAAAVLIAVGGVGVRELTARRAPGAHTLDVSGARAAFRGAKAPAVRPRFVPDSQVKFTLEPEPGAHLALLLEVLREEEGHLIPLHVGIERVQDEDGERFEISASGAALFAPLASAQTLVFVLADARDALDGVANGTLEEVAARRSLRTLTLTADYDPGTSSLTPRLHGGVYLAETDEGIERAYSRRRPPAARIEGAYEDRWAFVFEADDGAFERLDARSRPSGAWTVIEAEPKEIPAGRGRLRLLRSGHSMGAWPARFVTPPSERPYLAEAVRLRDANALDAAHAEVTRQLESARGEARLWLLTERGRVEHRAGRTKAATATWAEAARVAAQLRIPSEASARLRAIAFLKIQDHAFAEALSLIDEARAIDRRIGNERGLARALYYEGFATKRAGIGRPFLQARRLYEAAIDSALSRGDEEDRADFTQLLATLLAENGHYREALRRLERVPPPSSNPLKLYSYLGNLSWVRYSAMESGAIEWDYAQLREDREAMLALLGGQAPAEMVNTKARLALAAMRVGEIDAAGALLDQLDASDPEDRGWVKNLVPALKAELAVRRGRPDEAIADLEPRIEDLDRGPPTDREAAILARILLADARRARGDPRGAIEAYTEAIQQTEALARRFVVPRSVGQFYSRARNAYGALAQTQLDVGDLQGAWQTAQRLEASRLDALRLEVTPERQPQAWREYRAAALAQRAAGCEAGSTRVACSEADREVRTKLRNLYAGARKPTGEEGRACLEHLGPGQLYLAMIRGPRGWMSLLYDAQGEVRARPDDAFLEAWGPDLEAAEALYVSPGGHPGAYDLPVAARDGRPPLGAVVPVSLLPHCSLLGQAARPSVGRSLFVADPRGDLPDARRAARRYMRGLPGASLLEGPAASREAILSRWAELDLLHIGSHGIASPADAFEVSLTTAEAQLQVSDVLLFRPRIGAVVLDACSSGLNHEQLTGEALVNALLLAGTRTVLASSQDIPDGSSAFLEEFYSDWSTSQPVAKAYQHALMALYRRQKLDTGLFRLYGHTGI